MTRRSNGEGRPDILKMSQAELRAVFYSVPPERRIMLQAPHTVSIIDHPAAPASNGQYKLQDALPVMTTEEVAALLRIDRSEVRKLRLPELPHVPGHKHRYLRSGVLRTLEEGANGTTR